MEESESSKSKRRPRVKFTRTLIDYARGYGYTDDRTIKNWVKVGKDNGDLPPLDQPEQMAEWWQRNHHGRPLPKGLRGLEQMELAPTPAPAAAPPPPSAFLPPADAGEIHSFPEQVAALRLELSRGLSEVQRIQKEECPAAPPDAIAWARGRSARLEIAQRNYKGTFDILRKAENDLVEWQKKHDRLVDKSEVSSEVTRIFGAIHKAVKRLLRKVRPALHGLTDSAADALWDTETRACFDSLTRSEFSTDGLDV